jgi:hypothetical protein
MCALCVGVFKGEGWMGEGLGGLGWWVDRVCVWCGAGCVWGVFVCEGW